MRSIAPSELQGLLTTDVDIVDVRDPSEWMTGHVPGARLVPLAQLRVDPKGALPRDNIAFVCASGTRSNAAAAIAEQIGKTAVMGLNGGINAWRAAGLPIVMPDPLQAQAQAPAADVVEPALDAVVGENVKRERTARGISLDEMARDSGVSRALLGQIELGNSVPSIGVIWKIAQTLGVPFSTLIATAAPRIGTSLSQREKAKKLLSADGRFSSRALYPLGDPHAAEFYELWLAPHSKEEAEAHRPGTRENLVVTSGRLELKIGSETVQLGVGDAVNFSADQPHAYINPSGEECFMYLVMTYAGAKKA